MKNEENDIELPVVGINRHRIGIDGQGVRTLIIVEGCPLRCRYCINPHTWNGSAKVRNFTVSKLYDYVSIDNIYFLATGGGITFGGGEPLLYPEFISSFISACPDGWDFRIETSLNVPAGNALICAELFSEIIVDIKAYDKDKYSEYTGGSADNAFSNLRMLLDRCSEKITVRVPVIPGITTEADRQKYADQLSEIGVRNIQRFTYVIKAR